MGYFPRSKIQQAIDAALSDDRLEEYTAGDVEHAWQDMDRCLAKVDDDEPIFVLRAQDLTMLHTIEYWRNVNGQLSPERLADLDVYLLAVVDWQQSHPDRMKMAD